jgi:hypothetical protein
MSCTTPIVNADAEIVQAKAWRDEHIHVSRLTGIQKYGGCSFESLRYLVDDDNVLVCNSMLHPTDLSCEKATVTWKFCEQKLTSCNY